MNLTQVAQLELHNCNEPYTSTSTKRLSISASPLKDELSSENEKVHHSGILATARAGYIYSVSTSNAKTQGFYLQKNGYQIPIIRARRAVS
jgi:hypothetical protein